MSSFAERVDSARTFTAAHRSDALDLVRIYLGLGLCVRGAYFVGHVDEVLGTLALADFPFTTMAVGHLVALAHLAGGLMLAAGLFTRASAAVQLPVLLGAVVFVEGPAGLFTASGGLEFAALVLFLLAVFSVVGSGRLSVDAAIPGGRRSARDPAQSG